MILAPLFASKFLVRTCGALQELQIGGASRPQTGSAVHHLVTALSLKKALTVRRGFSRAIERCAAAIPTGVMRPAHTWVKCVSVGRSRIAPATS